MKWWQIRRRDADLERELQSDLELEEEEQRANGLSAEEARRAALLQALEVGVHCLECAWSTRDSTLSACN